MDQHVTLGGMDTRAMTRRAPEAANPSVTQRRAALAVLSEFRRIEHACGIDNSRIALDVMLYFYSRNERGLQVREIAQGTGHTGPTVRLVLARLMSAGSVAADSQVMRTVFYRLTPAGEAAMDSYVDALARLRG
jgi:DNA-binding MarR family transcriptional regulator